MRSIQFLLLVAVGLVSSCSSNSVAVGNKTEMSVNKVFDAGEVLKGETVNAVFTVKNEGDFPLVIAEVKGSCSCTVASKPEEPIAPGEEATIKASVNTEKTGEGSVAKSIRIVANTTPSTTEVIVKATVKSK